MGLSWDVTKVQAVSADADERAAWFAAPNVYGCTFKHGATGEPTAYDNWTLVDALIWRSMSLGWGWALTDVNVETAIMRNYTYERIFGGVHLTAAFIRAMVGLETNVSAKTDAVFWKDVRRTLEEMADRDFRRDEHARKQAESA